MLDKPSGPSEFRAESQPVTFYQLRSFPNVSVHYPILPIVSSPHWLLKRPILAFKIVNKYLVTNLKNLCYCTYKNGSWRLRKWARTISRFKIKLSFFFKGGLAFVGLFPSTFRHTSQFLGLRWRMLFCAADLENKVLKMIPNYTTMLVMMKSVCSSCFTFLKVH